MTVRTRPKAKPAKLSPAERARRELLRQRAEAERLRLALAARLAEIALVRELMEQGYDLAAERLPNQADRWESLELARLNATRPPSRVLRRLPASAYEQKCCGRYGGGR